MKKLLIGMLLLAICSCSRSLESAREKAISEFVNQLQAMDINQELFSGPELVFENEDKYLFHWISLVPQKGDKVIQVSVPKYRGKIIGVRDVGERESWVHLGHTGDFPFNEAMLTNLFGLPPTPKINNDETKRLRNVDLNPRQLVDVANFVEVKRRLMDYRTNPRDITRMILMSLISTVCMYMINMGRNIYI